MENAFNYITNIQENMQGGDSRFNHLTHTQRFMYKEATPDLELDVKTKRVTEKLSESMNIIANEPSLAFFRIQEHVRRCLPQLTETKYEVQDLQQRVQGACFDTEYAANAVADMHKSSSHFQKVQELLKNAMFNKQQLDYEQSRSGRPVGLTQQQQQQPHSPSIPGPVGADNETKSSMQH